MEKNGTKYQYFFDHIWNSLLGVTGTAKDHVVVDYADRMVDSIHRLQNIMSQSAHYLLTSSKAFYKPKLENHWFDIDDFRKSWNSLPKQSVIQIESADEPSKVVLFNSHARRRTEVVSIYQSQIFYWNLLLETNFMLDKSAS